MAPEFALHLSLHGISLDRRVPDGWVRLGEVPFDNDTLADALETLRKAAGTDPVHVRVVLPDDQIKWLKIPGVGLKPTALKKAFDGETPYALDELEYDFRERKKKTRAAAVAHETLEEADLFTRQHGFVPVAFVGIDKDGDPLEFLFRAASETKDTVARDDHPYTLVEDDGGVEATTKDISFKDTHAEDAEADQDKKHPGEDKKPTGKDGVRDEKPSDGKEDGPGPKGDTLSDGRQPPKPAPPPTSPAAGAEPPFVAKAPKLGSAIPPPPPPPKVRRVEGDTLPEPRLSADSLLAKTSIDAPPVKIDGGKDKEPSVSAKQQAKKAAAATGDLVDTANTHEGPVKISRQIGGKPRFLLLVLIAALLAFMAGVAAWAAVTRDGPSLAMLILKGWAEATPAEDVAPALPEPTPADTNFALPAVLQNPDIATETLLPPDAIVEELAELGTAELDPPFTEQQAQAHFDTTGVWAKSPKVQTAPLAPDLDRMRLATLDSSLNASDAVALPSVDMDQDVLISRVVSPPPADQRFTLDDRGLVIATPEGALAPGGYRVVASRPPVVPTPRPDGLAPIGVAASIIIDLSRIRPLLRPDDLVENAERAVFGGLTRAELAEVRPVLRPLTAQETATAANLGQVDPIALAASPRPAVRPDAVVQAAIAQRAERDAAPQQAAAPTPVALKTVQPKIPTVASVARAATIEDGINLRRLNLVGVFGTSSQRKALVRTSNGQFVRVGVGDKLDGGEVVAIGASALRYVKRGRDIVLELPKG